VTPVTEAFHLPAGAAGDEATWRVVAEGDGVVVRAPAHSPAGISHVCRQLVAARQRLREMSTARVVAALDGAARHMLQPSGREPLLHALAAATGYSPAMAAAVLERMASDWTAAALTGLVEAEFGSADAIDGFVRRAPGIRSRAEAPALGFHVFAGNVPGVSITSIARSLLVRTAVLGKVAAAEPVTAPAFARSLAEVDAEVAAAVAVTWWPGGDEELEAAALRHAGIVVHYGGAEAIASLRGRAPGHVRFVDHGPRVSFALAGGHLFRPGAGQAFAAAARDAALAVATFDQQGCVSPHMLYVLAEPADARALAAAIARELGDVARRLPRGSIGPGEAAAVRELRSSAEFRAIAGADVELWAPRDLAWTVIYDGDPAFSGSCLNRTLMVKSVPDLDALVRVLQPAASLLQTAGLCGFGEEVEAVARRLGDVGVTRVTPLRAMPWPPPAWHHDGRGPLVELTRWLDLESD
jgi:hypothetical protein